MNYTLLVYLLTISATAFHIIHQKAVAPPSKSDIEATANYTRIDQQRYHATYSFIHSEHNTILQEEGLSAFYEKLWNLKAGHTKRVNIVQIGDSHTQPDLIAREVRSGLQHFFGDAGRGLVFPYQIARTNAPFDIASSAPTRWLHSQISRPHASNHLGIAGFSLRKSNGNGTVRLSLKPDINANQQLFDCVKLFVGQGTWQVHSIDSHTTTYTVKQSGQTTSKPQEILLKSPTHGIDIRSMASNPHFFGVSLEKKDASGVLFHTIGVNGARYKQYNDEPLFWEQLPALEVDLYILSLGTNEAFYNDMTEESYINDVSETIARIQTINPKAAILVSTTAESFKYGRINPMIERLNLALKFYCHKQGIPVWDLFEITGGSGSAQEWLKNGLLQADKIHYQQKAYSMQGALLFDALASGYNQFIEQKSSTVEFPLAKTVDK